MRVNLGAGQNPIEGYDNSFDAGQGKKAYPLDLPDESCDEVRASHLLEHFGHRGAPTVIKEWARVLKPGGVMRLAVPDLEVIAKKYVAGEPGDYQGWMSGGQIEPLDNHLAQYDWDSLSALMRGAGLVGLHGWGGDDPDSSSLDVSLNIAGYKRPLSWPKVVAVMSRPRLGFMDQFGCAMDALAPMGIPILSRTGAYWGKCMSAAINAALELKPGFILTLDYDTMFTRQDIEDLLAFAIAAPDVSAFVAAQMTRVTGLGNPLLMNPKEGVTSVSMRDLEQPYYPVRTGHFGCSLFSATSLETLPRPWFFPTFKDGGEPAYDDDINFWLAFEKAGFKAALVPRVVVGHLECVVMWPDRNLKMLYQRTSNFREGGKPRGAWR
jgi:SAM-dependent methyltransferase